jgi:hypothetical protein
MRSLAVFLAAAMLLMVGAALVVWFLLGALKGLAEVEDQSCQPYRHDDNNYYCYEPPPAPPRS